MSLTSHDHPEPFTGPGPDAGATSHPRQARPSPYRYYDLILGGFVAVLLLSNLVAAPKLMQAGPWTIGAGVLCFPLSYLFGDVLTEVYGYARARRVVWVGFGALVFTAIVTQGVLALPPAPSWTFRTEFNSEPVLLSRQVAWEQVFGGTWRVVAASIAGFFAGEFLNSYTLARLKVLTRGRWLAARTIGSTVVGEAADSLLFYPLAFLGTWPTGRVVEVMATNYLLKVGWEVLATPLTYRLVGFLKQAEGVDHFDDRTNFTPFTLAT